MDKKHLATLLALLTLTGCQAPNPMGLSDAQWTALSPDQQAEYRRQQTVIDEQRRKERAEAAARQQAIDAQLAAQKQAQDAERARMEAAQLQMRYLHARYGDIVTVTISEGLIDFGKHRAYEPVRFEILKGERKLVEISQQGNSHIKALVPVYLAEDGQTFYFDENARDRITLINSGNAWQAGKKYESLTIMDKGSKSIASAISIHLQFKDFGRNTPQPRPQPGKPLPR